MSKPILIRLQAQFRTGRYFALDQLNSGEHGPFRFSPTGVGFGPADEPAFVPWGAVAGVDGWEPPVPGAYVEDAVSAVTAALNGEPPAKAKGKG